jgi:hypothetical protein
VVAVPRRGSVLSTDNVSGGAVLPRSPRAAPAFHTCRRDTADPAALRLFGEPFVFSAVTLVVQKQKLGE